MADGSSYLPQQLSIEEIADYHNDVISSLRNGFQPITSERTVGIPVSDILELRIQETNMRSALAILASLEATFRVDFECRCQNKLKDDVSRAFREIHKQQKGVRLDEDIFDTWSQHSIIISGPRQLVGELRGAFKFRHWLAHGRYWNPKLGRKYDYNGIYHLADTVLAAFPFLSL
jgi:hypothetical protein